MPLLFLNMGPCVSLGISYFKYIQNNNNLDSTIPMPVPISGILALVQNTMGVVDICYTSRM